MLGSNQQPLPNYGIHEQDNEDKDCVGVMVEQQRNDGSDKAYVYERINKLT